MGEGERKLRPGVIEILGGLERLQSVTGGAIAVAELSTVGILVAGGAADLETQEGATEVDLLGDEWRRIGDRLLAMAGAAGERGVRPLQGVAGGGVVESFLAGLAPIDQVEGAALMLDMAALTGGVVRTGVQALAGFDAPRQWLVAGEAAPAVDAVLGAVAMEAAVAAVEVGVGPAELTGRDLGACRRRAGERSPDTGENRGRSQVPAEDCASSQWPILA